MHKMQKAQITKPINGRLFKDHALQARYGIDISNRFSALTFANDASLPDMWEQFREEVTDAAIKCTKSIKPTQGNPVFRKNPSSW